MKITDNKLSNGISIGESAYQLLNVNFDFFCNWLFEHVCVNGDIEFHIDVPFKMEVIFCFTQWSAMLELFVCFKWNSKAS